MDREDRTARLTATLGQQARWKAVDPAERRRQDHYCGLGDAVKVFIIIFGAFPLIFIGIGAYGVWDQHHKITTYQPVTAKVRSTRVAEHRGKSTTYSPEVMYRYKVGDVAYTSRNVLPFSESASYAWAQEIISHYNPRQSTEAYYDPAKPGNAFLLKHYSFAPYLFVLFPMIFLVVPVGLYFGQAATRPLSPPAPQPDGWYELKPASRVAARGQRALVVTGVWQSIVVLTSGHYFSAATPPYETAAIVATGIYGALGCIPLAMAIYYFLVRRHIGDARIFVNTPQFALGEEVTLLIQQPVYTGLQITSLNANLVCNETTKTTSGGKTCIRIDVCYRDVAILLSNHPAQPRETLTGTHTFTLPEEQTTSAAASSPPKEKGYPRFAWQIEVHTKIAHGPDYRGKFPLIVIGGKKPQAGASPEKA